MSENKRNSILQIAAYFLIGGVMFVVMFQGSLGLVPLGLFTVVGITLVFGVFSYFLGGSRKFELVKRISKVVFISGIVNLVLFFIVSNVQSKLTREKAGVLIGQLEKYKENYGTYPKRLVMLVPKYFEDIPKSWIGLIPNGFVYDYSENKNHQFNQFKPINKENEYHFWIGYSGFFGVECYYNSKTKGWVEDD